MTQVEYNGWKYKRRLQEFRDYLIYQSLSKRIRTNDPIYKEYCRLLQKYEEFFELNEI